MVIVASLPRSMIHDFNSLGLDFQDQAWFPTCWVGFKIHLESCWWLTRYMCHYCALRVIMPFWLWFTGAIVGCGCRLLSFLWKLAWCLFLLWKLFLREIFFFQIIASQGSLGSVSEVCGVFINMNLSSTPGGQPKAVTIVFNALGVFWKTLPNSS